MFLKSYPFDPGIINFSILGNHDRDFFNGGLDLKQLLNKKRFDIKTLGYESAFIKVKNDEISLIHPLNGERGKKLRNGKIIFRGHSHVPRFRTSDKTENLIFYVPTCSNMFYYEYEYPGIYDVIFKFGKIGIITEIHINSYIYIDRLVKVGCHSHDFLTPEQYDTIKYEEKPKKLLLTK